MTDNSVDEFSIFQLQPKTKVKCKYLPPPSPHVANCWKLWIITDLTMRFHLLKLVREEKRREESRVSVS